MAKLKITIHPLFFIFGLYFAFSGKVFSFLVFTITALLHEFGHYLTSSKLGYELNEIILMPYGALLYGDTIDIMYKDECKIAISGPLLNGFIAIFFVALWWFFPDLYPYTELIVLANACMGIINLLPCFPLDGGRFLLATLSLYFSPKKSEIIVRVLGIILASLLLVIFIYSCFTTFNLSLLFFSLFMMVGAISKNEKNRYIKIYQNFNYLQFRRIKQIKKLACHKDLLIKDLYPYLDSEHLFEITVFSPSGNIIKTLKGDELYQKLYTSSPYDKIIN